MRKEEFANEEINENFILYVDKYIKLMISNTKISFIRKDKGSDLPDCDLIYLNDAKCIFPYYDEEILGFEDTTYLIGKSKIIIKGSRVSECLDKLTEREREVLLKNIVLKTPLDEIADDYNVSVRMVKHYKKREIEKMRKWMI